MQEAKYQIKNWKKWKATKYLLIQTKNELMNDIKAITYTDELPGGSHKSIADKYNKLIEDVKIYDDYINAYGFFINRLENAIATMLNENQRKAVIIYSNNPYKGGYEKRIEEAKKLLKNTNLRISQIAEYTGYFYDLLTESYEILGSVLDIECDENRTIIESVDKSRTKNA